MLHLCWESIGPITIKLNLMLFSFSSIKLDILLKNYIHIKIMCIYVYIYTVDQVIKNFICVAAIRNLNTWKILHSKIFCTINYSEYIHLQEYLLPPIRIQVIASPVAKNREQIWNIFLEIMANNGVIFEYSYSISIFIIKWPPLTYNAYAPW